MPPKRILNSIQVLRGIAAFVVLIYHVSSYQKMHYSQAIFGDIFRIGFAGVDLFFVISGFIIYYTANGLIGKPNQFLSYWSKRSIRVFPIYWLVILSIQLLQWFLSKQLHVVHFTVEYDMNFWNTLKTYTLFPNHIAIDPVTWTLSHELYFYTLFSLLILSQRLWFLPIIVFCLSVHNSFFHPYGEPSSGFSYYNFLFSNYNIEFLLGCLICRYLEKIQLSVFMSLGVLLAALCIIGVWGYDVGDYDNFKRILVFGSSACLVLVSFLSLENAGIIKAPQSLILLGGASYVLYLIHFPTFLIMNKLPSAIGIKLDATNASIFNYMVILINVLLAILIHKKIELPLTTKLSHYFKRSNK
ncbi:acyltransferase family protein [Flectobacillus longus]|uniref:acyltransferase family protein n=1 Tax=Flectobacillus longus TaxID=2984207 RepID=UPI0024B71F82|nr:acyltransferase [Flectobacillus longus]MDI9880155.1 acyltransferase [Flectobacillus longus]